ncbi:hypothetical protein CHLRE_09g392650v5 [Chlamydomonas reinhardtii]|uniref:RING-type domain-containing protein n=1 Tax=Chlamydomonas reinhardtii TaxID=3055 RepID=A0A2K3DDD6_CHLRE|nr:uncharacterized protein CHLRE_09g392650v5 [Chlamydomonas reinhardtii]PNW78548.1 hypothetical protein CHLRE_09g392650v5 [Chlamydomonas reinhardtii]
MKRDKDSKAKADRHALLAAAALQDHLARRLRMPGGPAVQPSLEPGAPMTLAQHLGLIPRPPPLLTDDQWTEVHLRSRLRQDSANECVICREEFQTGAQVLLSCSHTFHRHCLASFERYSRAKTCPLCRAEQYQKRPITDGQQLYTHKCATRIQAAWRGHAARRVYRELQRRHPPKDERLRKKWAAERLQEENDRLLSEMEDEVGDLDSLFAELDASVAKSREVCDAALRPLAARLQQGLMREAAAEAAAAGAGGRGGTGRRRRAAGEYCDDSGEDEEVDEEEGASASGRGGRLALVESGTVAPAVARSGQQHLALQLGRAGLGVSLGLGADGAGHAGGAAGAGAAAGGAAGAVGGVVGGGGGPGARPATAAEVDWDAVVARARARGTQDCPICLGHISRRGNEGIAWLSCTHCFHIDCIMAFEAFELASGGTPSCPVCRSGYRRRCFT